VETDGPRLLRRSTRENNLRAVSPSTAELKRVSNSNCTARRLYRTVVTVYNVNCNSNHPSWTRGCDCKFTIWLLLLSIRAHWQKGMQAGEIVVVETKVFKRNTLEFGNIPTVILCLLEDIVAVVRTACIQARAIECNVAWWVVRGRRCWCHSSGWGGRRRLATLEHSRVVCRRRRWCSCSALAACATLGTRNGMMESIGIEIQMAVISGGRVVIMDSKAASPEEAFVCTCTQTRTCRDCDCLKCARRVVGGLAAADGEELKAVPSWCHSRW
jgi:hypothetical protein